MKKAVWSGLIVIALGIICGCNASSSTPTAVISPTPASPTPPPATSQANPTVVITYTPVFADSGSVLVLDMTIENRGYDSFKTAPEYFTVMVSNASFKYDPAKSDLKTVELADGARLSGRLAFTVPSGTASSKVGYRLVYTGERLYNVWWTSTGTAATPGAPATSANPAVIIKYSPTFVLQSSGYYLVVNLSIENKGYDSFNTAPERFSVLVSNARSRYEPALSDMRALDIPNGGKLLGKLAFPVPSGAASPKVGYKLDYSGDIVYNVWWVEVE